MFAFQMLINFLKIDGSSLFKLGCLIQLKEVALDLFLRSIKLSSMFPQKPAQMLAFCLNELQSP